MLFSTSSNKIAVISKKGVITAKGVGTTRIVLTDSTSITKICDVTIKKALRTIKVNFMKKRLKK